MRYTASKTDLLLACRYSLRPDVAPGYDPDTAGSTEGREMHAALEAMVCGEPIAEQYRDAANLVGMWLSATWPSVARGDAGMVAEAAIAWSPSTGLADTLGRGRGSYTDAEDDDVCGCADLVIDEGATVTIVDWKTGEFGARKAQMQLRTLGLMVGTAYGVDRVRIMSVLVDPEGSRAPEVHVDETMGPLEMAAHADMLRDALGRIEGAEPVLGDHCRECFCSQQGSCPARGALVEAATTEFVQLGRRNPLTAPIDSDADAAALVEMLPHIEGYIKRRKHEVQAYVEALGGELRVSNTHVYRRTHVRHSNASAPKALALAKQLGATPDELAQCLTDSSYDRWGLIKRGA